MQDAPGSPNIDNEKAYDDIDVLLCQLKTIEPPPAIIARILDQVQARAIGGKMPSLPLTRRHLDNSDGQGKRRDN